MNLSDIKDEKEALDQSIALNKIVMDLLKHQKKQSKLVCTVLIISILTNLAIVGAFLWYESGMVTTTTTTQEVEGDGSDINNVGGDQDNSIYNERACE